MTIWRDGERLIFEPQRARGLLGLLSSWKPLRETLPQPENPIPAPEDVL